MVKPSIVLRDVPNSEAVEAKILSKVEKLQEFYSHIQDIRIVVEFYQKNQHQGRLFDVHIEVDVPGKRLVADRHPNEDLYIAIRNQFSAIKQQLERYRDKQRGDVKTHPITQRNVVVDQDGA